MYDLVVTLTRVLDVAAVQCRAAAKRVPVQSVEAEVMRILAAACEKAAAELTGAAVRAARVG
jgi:hypothetical protein